MVSFIVMLLLQWGALNTNTTHTITIENQNNQHEQPVRKRDNEPRILNVVEDDNVGG